MNNCAYSNISEDPEAGYPDGSPVVSAPGKVQRGREQQLPQMCHLCPHSEARMREVGSRMSLEMFVDGLNECIR